MKDKMLLPKLEILRLWQEPSDIDHAGGKAEAFSESGRIHIT